VTRNVRDTDKKLLALMWSVNADVCGVICEFFGEQEDVDARLRGLPLPPKTWRLEDECKRYETWIAMGDPRADWERVMAAGVTPAVIVPGRTPSLPTRFPWTKLTIHEPAIRAVLTAGVLTSRHMKNLALKIVELRASVTVESLHGSYVSGYPGNRSNIFGLVDEKESCLCDEILHSHRSAMDSSFIIYTEAYPMSPADVAKRMPEEYHNRSADRWAWLSFATYILGVADNRGIKFVIRMLKHALADAKRTSMTELLKRQGFVARHPHHDPVTCHDCHLRISVSPSGDFLVSNWIRGSCARGCGICFDSI